MTNTSWNFLLNDPHALRFNLNYALASNGMDSVNFNSSTFSRISVQSLARYFYSLNEGTLVVSYLSQLGLRLGPFRN